MDSHIREARWLETSLSSGPAGCAGSHFKLGLKPIADAAGCGAGSRVTRQALQSRSVVGLPAAIPADVV